MRSFCSLQIDCRLLGLLAESEHDQEMSGHSPSFVFSSKLHDGGTNSFATDDRDLLGEGGGGRAWSEASDVQLVQDLHFTLQRTGCVWLMQELNIIRPCFVG